MKWIPVLMLSFAMLGDAQAAGPDDQYIEIYSLIQKAEGLSNDPRAAVAHYTQAQAGLKKLSSVYPNWNPDIVKFRLGYVADKLAVAEKALAQSTSSAAAATVAAMPKLTPTQELQQEVATLTEQIQSLQADKSSLEKKLKEALSVQPAAVDATELAKAEQTITALKKERDLLSVSLEQEKAARAQKPVTEVDDKKLQDETRKASVLANERDALQVRVKELEKNITQLRTQAAEERDAAAKKLEAVNQELGKVKIKTEKTEAAPKSNRSWLRFWSSDKKSGAEEPKKVDPAINKLEKDRTELENKLSAANKALAEVKGKTEEELNAARSTAKNSEKQRVDLEEKLVKANKELAEVKAQSTASAAKAQASATVAAPAVKRAGFFQNLNFFSGDKSEPKKVEAKAPSKKEVSQIAQLKARVAALEATPVPYTKEELALMTQAPVQLEAITPAPTAAKSGVRSIRDLPAGAGAMMADAQRAFRAGDFAAAETKYSEVLRQDEKNVYVLSHLASAQLAAAHFSDCEKTVQQALAVDPADAASLYLLGNLRLRQDKLDEALNALSRSAEINPTNAATQNSLGGVLNQKGLRKPAEAALRKALQLDPTYAEAHHNLAIVYASQKPPFMELARWHYKKAVDFGHPKNPDLQKLLEAK